MILLATEVMTKGYGPGEPGAADNTVMENGTVMVSGEPISAAPTADDVANAVHPFDRRAPR